LRAHIELVARSEGIPCGNSHSSRPFDQVSSLLS
jgi:hypothetical protein